MVTKNKPKIHPQLLPKNDPRYLNWRKSLFLRGSSWNKGKTKEVDSRLLKMSQTFKKNKIDNFLNWRKKLIDQGKILVNYPPFEKTSDLAFVIGLVLGDGHIQKFPRTEKLSVALGTDKPLLILFSRKILEKVFNKRFSLYYSKKEKVVSLYFYQKQLSERLEIPTGSRVNSDMGIPKWVWSNNTYIIGCLKGLFESDGSLSIHLPTSTYNLAFTNVNKRLLNDVFTALTCLGYHPEMRPKAIRLRRKLEVKSFEQLILFRKY